jgi:phosphoribosylaminoimidazolecarboxamide formyltransferase/IMP cyclohydrolase
VLQDRDATAAGEVLAAKVVSKRAPTDAEIRGLELAWRVCKHVKSNAIVLAIEDRTTGVGAGRCRASRASGSRAGKAGDLARGSVLASDAFFPFPDGVELAAKHGDTAIAQPGGSVKDADVIAAADAAGVAMVFTSSATSATEIGHKLSLASGADGTVIRKSPIVAGLRGAARVRYA